MTSLPIRWCVCCCVLLSASGLCAQDMPATILPVGEPFPSNFQPDALQFSPDSKTLLVNTTGIVWLLDVATGKLRAPGIQGPHSRTGADRPANVQPSIGNTAYDSVQTSNFTSDSKTLHVTTIWTIQKWEGQKGTALNRATKMPGMMQNAAVHPVTGNLFVVSSGLSYANPVRPQPAPVVGVALNPNNGKTVGKPLQFDLIPWPGNPELWFLKTIQFSPDGKQLLISHHNGMIRLFDMTKGKELPLPDLGPSENDPVRVLWSPDGTRLLVRRKNTFQLWDPINLRAVGQPVPKAVEDTNHGAEKRTAMAFAADSSTAAVACLSPNGRHSVQLINTQDGSLGTQFEPTSPRVNGDLKQIYFAGDKLVVFNRTFDAPVAWLFDKTGKPLARPTEHIEVHLAAVSPDGRYVATSSVRKEGEFHTRIWKLP